MDQDRWAHTGPTLKRVCVFVYVCWWCESTITVNKVLFPSPMLLHVFLLAQIFRPHVLEHCGTFQPSHGIHPSIPLTRTHMHTHTHVWPHCQDASLRLPPHVWGKRWRWGERTAEGKATRGWGACRNLHSAPGWWCLGLHALLSDSNSNNNYNNNNSVKA